jgi:crossover junction endodeoxyribonuclease RuvC
VLHADLVVVEGPSYASTSPHTHDRAGLWWLVVGRLLNCGHRVAIAPPSSRAKYGTGKGNAGKDLVLASVVRRYPDVEVTGNDEADALLLAAMGARRLGAPIDDLPKTHLAALSGVAWPEEDS